MTPAEMNAVFGTPAGSSQHLATPAQTNPFAATAQANPFATPVQVTDFFAASGLELLPLAGNSAAVPSPADSGITAGPGDDTSAPNATTAQRLNRVVCATVANVGYSEAKKDSSIPPVVVAYDAEVSEGPKGYSMNLHIILEYASNFPDEGMVVWLKKKQQVINDEKLSELMLIETSFEDWVDGSWVQINTDIRYAEEAEAVVQAVITSDSGQTAGRIKTTGAVEDAKLGPVGQRGRIRLTYFCEELYSYAEMNLGTELHRRSLVPLAFHLPWAPFDSPAASCQVQVHVRGPAGSKILNPAQHILAYRDLQQSLAKDGSNPEQFGGVAMVIPEESDGKLKFDRNSLPPKPTAVLAWLSIPDADDGWEQVGTALPPTTRVTLLQPSPQDAPLMSAALAGGQTGQLIRCRVDTEAAQRNAEILRVHTDIVISDASGSTGMRTGGGETVRDGFNKHEERRLLKRLEAIPHLISAGVLLPHDVWRVLFVAFDHGVKTEFGLETCISDLDGETVSKLIEALAGVPGRAQPAEAALTQQGKAALLASWKGFLANLKTLTPGGATSFVAGAEKAKHLYAQSRQQNPAGALSGRVIERTAYVNFDTDGGNNCGSCYSAIKSLVGDSDVVQGHVLGVGSWVDQDCASKVARILKGSANLAVHFPADAGADVLFRQDLSRWIKVLRSQPISMTVSAGASAWHARQGARSENAAECIFARAEGVRFGPPDISQLDYTKAFIQGLQAGESAMLYILSRLSFPELQRQLVVELGGHRASVSVGPELLHGVSLGYHWISLLGGGPSGAVPVVANNAALCSRLKNRLEDDLSFAWNLPTKSGSTAALGRSRTQHRRPVAQQQQPNEPTIPEKAVPSSMPGWGSSGALFGGNGGGALFGGGMAPPPSAAFGAPMPQMLCAAAAPAASAQMMGGGGALFGSPASAGPPPAPAFGGMGGKGKGGARRGGGGGGGGTFGGSWGGMGGMGGMGGWGDEPEPAAAGPEEPTSILRNSRLCGLGPSDVHGREDVKRALAALKYSIGQVNNATAGQAAVPEDPLVSQLLGTTPKSMGAVHAGFTCDNCKIMPITGPRFKATNTADIDLCMACRKTGHFAGGSGFVLLADMQSALRGGLQAVLDWWPLLLDQHAHLFQQGPRPQLSTLSLTQLQQAAARLPDLH